MRRGIEQKLAKSEKDKEIMQERLNRVEQELKVLIERLSITDAKVSMINS